MVFYSSLPHAGHRQAESCLIHPVRNEWKTPLRWDMDHRAGLCCSLHTLWNDSTKPISHNQNKICKKFVSVSLFSSCCYVKIKTAQRRWAAEKDQVQWDRTARRRPSSFVSAFSILCSIKCRYTLTDIPGLLEVHSAIKASGYQHYVASKPWRTFVH